MICWCLALVSPDDRHVHPSLGLVRRTWLRHLWTFSIGVELLFFIFLVSGSFFFFHPSVYSVCVCSIFLLLFYFCFRKSCRICLRNTPGYVRLVEGLVHLMDNDHMWISRRSLMCNNQSINQSINRINCFPNRTTGA